MVITSEARDLLFPYRPSALILTVIPSDERSEESRDLLFLTTGAC